MFRFRPTVGNLGSSPPAEPGGRHRPCGRTLSVALRSGRRLPTSSRIDFRRGSFNRRSLRGPFGRGPFPLVPFQEASDTGFGIPGFPEEVPTRLGSFRTVRKDFRRVVPAEFWTFEGGTRVVPVADWSFGGSRRVVPGRAWSFAVRTRVVPVGFRTFKSGTTSIEDVFSKDLSPLFPLFSKLAAAARPAEKAPDSAC